MKYKVKKQGESVSREKRSLNLVRLCVRLSKTGHLFCAFFFKEKPCLDVFCLKLIKNDKRGERKKTFQDKKCYDKDHFLRTS